MLRRKSAHADCSGLIYTGKARYKDRRKAAGLDTKKRLSELPGQTGGFYATPDSLLNRLLVFRSDADHLLIIPLQPINANQINPDHHTL